MRSAPAVRLASHAFPADNGAPFMRKTRTARRAASPNPRSTTHEHVHQSRHRHRRRHRHRQGRRPRVPQGRLPRRPRRTPQRTVAAGDRGRRGAQGRRAGGAHRRRRPGVGGQPLRPHQGSVWPPRCTVQQCGRRRAGDQPRGPDVRAVEERRRHQPDRRLPLHPGSVPDDEEPGPARRPDHQQRIDLGARAAARIRRPTRRRSTRSRASRNRRRSTAGSTTSPAGRSTSATRTPRWRRAWRRACRRRTARSRSSR